ncbi:MAG: hypothetical protein SFX74_05425 [Fimbriimonadaceae bacterium]|nr:hypothetical protein [Fimbriimonadaceae bacterium]
MSKNWKLFGWIFAAVLVVWLVFNVILPLVFGVAKLALAIAVVAAIGYVAYRAIAPKSIGGGRRTLP